MNSRVTKERFIYMYTGKLNDDEIHSLVKKGIDNYILSTGKKLSERRYDLVINVVEDKEYQKKGFAYGWISDIGLFNALIGKNEDGTERISYEDDPDWEEPDDIPVKVTLDMDWSSLVEEECPQIKIELPGLIEVESYYDEEDKKHTLDFFGASVPERYGYKNEIYSTNIPKFINENFLENVFSKFCTDDTLHSIKKKKVKYPIIQIFEKNGKRNCQIEFSPLDRNLAPFILTMNKKLRYGTGKRDIIFFTQSKKK